MSYNLIYVHAVVSVKKRRKALKLQMRNQLFKEIRRKSPEYGVKSVYVNGIEDHVHLLLLLPGTERMSDVVGRIKGYSSYWLNTNFPEFKRSFRWSKGFYADGVSRKDVLKVRDYIARQDEHHAPSEYREEWEMHLSG